MKNQQPPIDNSVKINPDNFVDKIDNPFYPLQPGTTFTYQSTDGSVVDLFYVTGQTKTILGVECVVVQDNVFTDGTLSERRSTTSHRIRLAMSGISAKIRKSWMRVETSSAPRAHGSQVNTAPHRALSWRPILR